MEMTSYLSPQVQEVFKMVSRKVRVLDNGPMCTKYEIFGFFDAPRKELTICSRRIMASASRYDDMNATVLHESVHVAQSCGTSFRYLRPFGVKSSAMPLSAAKLAGLKKVIAFDARLAHIDREAFYMEDKPGLVASVLRKYCF